MQGLIRRGQRRESGFSTGLLSPCVRRLGEQGVFLLLLAIEYFSPTIDGMTGVISNLCAVDLDDRILAVTLDFEPPGCKCRCDQHCNENQVAHH